MTNVEKVSAYLDQARIFYVTTVDGDKPKCRPFGFKMIHDGKLYFGVGTFKDCYKQMQKNPHVEIAASDGKGFLRYYGKAEFSDDPALFEHACAEADFLAKMYNEETGRKLGLFCLTDATAEFRNLFEIEESLEM